WLSFESVSLQSSLGLVLDQSCLLATVQGHGHQTVQGWSLEIQT
ncbi:unnamed protein product, partial [Brassica rapa subsp. trilocularis]